MTASSVSERDLARYVADVARTFGWIRYHTWIAKHSAAGFPDEVLVRDGRLVFAELKSEKGRTTEAQEAWLEALQAVPGVEVHVWRPSDIDRIAEILR